ncbi:sensor histidine kinase [Streptomyces fimicarius]|uniref:sensor histidine kinase n=2 Tax=Streptomyces TaxID=1883 RepID=UPI000CD54D76|nr:MULTISPECIES: HAMP domain-containing sensor histidine kinase [Streptomyces]MCX4709010.1 HAMP domain-containing histidine kinase [Streptomyces griseus]MDX2674713.1 HAMP domain-containing sensor histidine kinase [Streptomyces sp. NRRL_ISP-5395]MDX3342235.1 HAMP domain-containing sensor histidine kinase [Streptomyces sp. ME02-6979.5a]MDX3595681.1 HAMP domain-containing sensor histidine kinase [Streptomyces sp. ID03-2B]WKN14891.1 HAMP domain-containing histidine kinase [Streptomyces sp. JUS-F4]
MRWALVKVCLAVTAMVVIAFAVPLGLVIREMASDRAFSDAERQAATIAPALSITTDREELTRAVLSTEPGDRGRLAVHVPAEDGPLDIGTRRATPKDVETVRKAGRASVTEVTGGFALLQPTALSTGDIAVVEVFVAEGDVSNGVATAWLMLAGVGVALIVGSVAVADRLGVRMVQPAQRLAGAAQDLGEGRLGTRVPEEGPTELRSAAVAFNSMADQVVQLLANERELAADLSHRLRTPLTVLRLNAASLGEGPAAEQTRAAVQQLEHEVDTIIRTAREQRPQTQGVQTGAGCDASEVIRERMGFWSALAEDEGREVRLAGVDRTVRIPVARPELAAALDALLGNVFRHTPEGTAFAVDVHHSGDAVIVLVSDAGPGIPDPKAALARGASGRDGSGGSVGSTGLGLDIVRRVAESTGGDLRIGRSVLGGTEVRIWIGLHGSRPERGRRGHGRRVGRRIGRQRGGERGGEPRTATGPQR